METTIQRTRLRTSSGPRGVTMAIWVLRLLLGALFVMSGSAKLVGAREMVELFNTVGMGEWLRYLTGAIELGGGAALLTPRVFGLGATAIMPVMAGAAITHVLILDRSPALPLVLLLGLAAVIWLQRAVIAGTFTQAILPSRS